MIARTTHRRLEQLAERNADRSFRTHLGASVLGDACDRKLWFGFRWMARESFDGRMLRLFARGDMEEQALADELRGLGATVWTKDEHGKQYRISDHGGHFGGSLDGVARGGVHEIPPDEAYLTEFKTHNARSFGKLVEYGVFTAKPVHWAQMQIYAFKTELPRALYMALNKDTAEVHLEIVQTDVDAARGLVARAGSLIFADTPPRRISSEPSWHECKFCPMHAVCHSGKAPEKNCRSCRHFVPLPTGGWRCMLGASADVTKGCSKYKALPTE